MVVLAASVCTRGGKPIISRQFRDMSRSRVEALLSSFPKLLSSNSQHTSVETDSVRYVYQPLEDLYMILITNKNSNILQDIDTLHLFARLVTDLCSTGVPASLSAAGAGAGAGAGAAGLAGAAGNALGGIYAGAAGGGAGGYYGGGGGYAGSGKVDERQVLRLSFELLGAFDEIIAMGYRENSNLMQIKNILEMESHEEKIQDIIERNKEQEAKEELKRRAKQLEMQRRDAARRGIPSSNFGGQFGAGGTGNIGNLGAQAPVTVHRENLGAAATVDGVARGGSGAAGGAKPFKGKGMQLGKKTKAPAFAPEAGGIADSVDDSGPAPGTVVDPAIAAAAAAPIAVGARTAAAAGTATASHTPSSAAAAADPSSLLPLISRDPIYVLVRERVTLTADRDGGLKSLEVKGDLEVRISDASLGKVRLSVTDAGLGSAAEMNWKTHPHVDKALWAESKIVALKDANKSFPLNQSLGVLRWRNTTSFAKDESLVPIAITCWPSPGADGAAEVTIEFNTDALEAAAAPGSALRGVSLVIPLPATLADPAADVEISDVSQGQAAVADEGDVLIWQLGDRVQAGESGSLEFTVRSGVDGADAAAFFPVQVDFWSENTIAKVEVSSITSTETQADVTFSQQSILSPDSYLVG